jgi:hypothetical protein
MALNRFFNIVGNVLGTTSITYGYTSGANLHDWSDTVPADSNHRPYAHAPGQLRHGDGRGAVVRNGLDVTGGNIPGTAGYAYDPSRRLLREHHEGTRRRHGIYILGCIALVWARSVRCRMQKALVSSHFNGKLVETAIAGRVTGPMINTMITDYRRLGGGTVWLIRAESATAYTAEAMNEAIKGFPELFKRGGLLRIVAVIVTPTVRMGAQVVAMSLRAAGSPIDIHVVNDLVQAKDAIDVH